MAAYDGNVKIGIQIDDSGVKSGLKSTEKNVRKTFEELAQESGKSVEQLKADAKRIAEEYQKQGYNIPNSYKKAYADMGVASKSVRKNMSDDADKTGDTHDKNAKKTESAWKNALNGIGSFAQKGFGVLKDSAISSAKVAASAIGAASAAVAGFAAKGTQYNASIEQYETSFEVMTGSASKAADTLTRLKKVGAETPFELADLADTTQLLMNYGFTADGAMDSMMMLGDISQGSADKMQRVATAYGQMSSAGKVSLEDVKQMIEAGFNPLQEISESTGESMASLYDRISKGTISVDEITASMQRATSAGGKYYQSMAKQSQTVNGLISTLKDNAEQLLGEVVGPITDSIGQELLPAAVDVIEDLSTAFKEKGVDGLIEAGGQMISNLLLGISNMLPGLVSTASSIITKILEALGENLPQIAQAGWDILTALLGGMAAILPQLGSMGLQIITTLGQKILENLPQIAQGGCDILNELINGLKETLPQLADMALEIITMLLDGLTEAAPDVISQAGDMLNDWLDEILKALPDILERGGDMISNLLNGLTKAAPDVISQAGKMLGDFTRTIAGHLPAILEKGVELVQKLLNGIIKNAPQLVGQAARLIADFAASIAKSAPSLLQKGIELIGKLLSGIVQAIPDIIRAIPEMIKKIGEAFLDKDWGQIGIDILEGIKNGLINAAKGLWDCAVNVVSDAFNGIKDWLGIHSPSKRARDEIGVNMIAGVGQGVEEETPELESSSVDSVKRTVKAMKKASASEFVGEMQAKVYHMSANNEMAARNKFQNNGYEPDEPDDPSINIHNEFYVDGRKLVDDTVKKTKREIAREQRSAGAAKGAVANG